MAKAFATQELLSAFDRIGEAALAEGQRIDIAVYGGSALMLASNFRFASEDVDIAPLDPWPDWLRAITIDIARSNNWSDDWLNDAVSFHLSHLAGEKDHVMLQSFPRLSDRKGLRVFVPTAEYMLALKLKALRVLDPKKGDQETADLRALLVVCGVDTIERAEQILARYFPVSAAAPEKLRFLLKHVMRQTEPNSHAPIYPQRNH